MYKFALEELKEVVGKIKFYLLKKDNVCQFQVFIEEIKSEGNYNAEINTIFSRMLEIAKLKRLPKNKFRPLKGDRNRPKEYEIKTKNLRVYLFHQDHTGHIIVLGAKKNPPKQKNDIRQFRNLCDEYLDSLKKT